jgi:hypothetical protein
MTKHAQNAIKEVVVFTDEEAQRIMRHIVFYAYRRWSIDSQVCDIHEYLEAGIDAFAVCLVRFDNALGLQFMTYFDRKLGWAMLGVARDYAHWKYRGGVKEQKHIEKRQRFEDEVELQQRISLLPDLIQRYAHAKLQGWTDEEFAIKEHRSEGWISQKLKAFRQAYAHG